MITFINFSELMEYNQDTPQSATDIMTWYTVRTEITTFLSKWLMNALTGNPEEWDY